MPGYALCTTPRSGSPFLCYLLRPTGVLERRDILGQAISHVRALQTNQWVAGGRAAQASSDNGAWIDDELTRLVRWEARWRFYFGRNGIEPLRLVYEEVMAEPRVDTTPLADHIQREELSEAWRRRYLAEHRDPRRFL